MLTITESGSLFIGKSGVGTLFNDGIADWKWIYYGKIVYQNASRDAIIGYILESVFED